MSLLDLLTTAKDAGIEVGTMVTLAGIYMRLETKAKERDKAMSKRNDERWGQLIDTLKDHNDKNELRFSKIENHIGLK